MRSGRRASALRAEIAHHALAIAERIAPQRLTGADHARFVEDFVSEVQPMIAGAVARRYAKALFAVAEEQGSLEQTAAELQLLGAIAEDPQIAGALANPLLSSTARRDLAGTIADNLKLSPTTRNFVSLLADHRRLDQLVGIAREFERHSRPEAAARPRHHHLGRRRSPTPSNRR